MVLKNPLAAVAVPRMVAVDVALNHVTAVVAVAVLKLTAVAVVVALKFTADTFLLRLRGILGARLVMEDYPLLRHLTNNKSS